MFAIAALLNQHTTADFVTPALHGELHSMDFSKAFFLFYAL